MNVFFKFNLDLQPFLLSGSIDVIEEFFEFTIEVIGNYFNIAKFCVLSYLDNGIETSLNITIPTIVNSINSLKCKIPAILNSQKPKNLVYLRLINDRNQISLRFIKINVIKPLGPFSLLTTRGRSNTTLLISTDLNSKFQNYRLTCTLGGVIIILN
jgi:hypothetical protein